MVIRIAAVLSLLATPALAAPPPEGSEDWNVMHPFAEWVTSQHDAAGRWCCDIGDGRPVEAEIDGDHWRGDVTPAHLPRRDGPLDAGAGREDRPQVEPDRQPDPVDVAGARAAASRRRAGCEMSIHPELTRAQIEACETAELPCPPAAAVRTVYGDVLFDLKEPAARWRFMRSPISGRIFLDRLVIFQRHPNGGMRPAAGEARAAALAAIRALA